MLNVDFSFTSNQAQKDYPWKIFSRLMAVLTVTSHVKALARLAEEEKMKKEDEQFLILTVSGRPPYNSF